MRTFGWHVDGQLASATHGGRTEGFTWDGLALVRRGGESFVNEPHLGGGAAVWSSGGGFLFNDLLATTLGAQGEDGAYTPFARTSFGEDVPRPSGSSGQSRSFFTGKPHVEGLGHAFLLRAYRPDLGKWLVADPLGYPDGWNQLAYCNNRVMEAIDWLGMWEYITLSFDQLMVFSPCVVIPEVQSTFDIMGVPKDIFTKIMRKILDRIRLEDTELTSIKKYLYSQANLGAYTLSPPTEAQVEARLRQMGIRFSSCRIVRSSIIDFALDATQRSSGGVIVDSGVETWRVLVAYE